MPDNFFENEKNEQKKEDIFARAQNKLNDNEFLKNVRTTLILIIIIGVPILYFGFFDNITLSALMSWNLGGLAIMSIALVTLLRVDTKSRAFDDGIKYNNDLYQTEIDIIAENDKISDHILGRRFVKDYNKQQHKIEDEKATDKAIDKLNLKITALQIKEKDKSKRCLKLKKKLAELKLKGKKGKFTDINYEDLYNLNGKANKRGKGAKADLTYNPKKESIIANLFGIFFKGFGLGAAGSIPFLFHATFKTILIYYLTLFIACAITVVQTYIKMRYKMSHKYFDTRKFRLHMLKLVNAYIANPPKEETPAVIDEKNTNTVPMAFPIAKSAFNNVSTPILTKMACGIVSHMIK